MRINKKMADLMDALIESGEADYPEDELLPHLKSLREKVSRDNIQLTRRESQCLMTVKVMIEAGFGR